MNFFFAMLAPFLFSCFQSKQKNSDFIEVTTSEALRSNIQSSDRRIVIGGHVTNYALSKADSINRFSIIIASDRCTDFTGIEQLRNLQWLSIILPETDEVDFTPINVLKKIQTLDIGGQYFTEIPDLSEIPSLNHLKVGSANLTTLDGIEKIPNLERLEVRDNRQPITDTSVIRHAGNLKYLQFFDGTNALKMSDLSGLTALEELRIAVYREHDLTGIGALQSLKRLYVAGYI
jgi:Leucine-rich repeat (LRR) protein